MAISETMPTDMPSSAVRNGALWAWVHCSRPCILEVNAAAVSDTGRLP